jgi:hypothetical protein
MNTFIINMNRYLENNFINSFNVSYREKSYKLCKISSISYFINNNFLCVNYFLNLSHKISSCWVLILQCNYEYNLYNVAFILVVHNE